MSLSRVFAWVIAATLMLTSCGPDPGGDARSRDLPVAQLDGVGDTAASRIRLAMEAAGTEPRQARAVGEYAMILHAYQQLEAADPAYELARALEEGPDPWALYHGVLLLDTDRPREALQAFETAEGGQVADVYRARALLADDRPSEAVALLEQVLETAPDRIDALLELAAIRQQSGDFVAAENYYRTVLDQEQGLAEAHYGLAQVLRATGQEAAALAELERFESYRGREWRSQDDPRRAIAELVVSERRYVDEAKAKLAQADYDSAIASLEEARGINPENLSTLTNLIALYGRVGRLEECVGAYRAAVAIDPNYYQAHFNLGVVMASIDREQEAESAFRRAAAIDPSRPDPYIEYGGLLSRHGEGRLAAEEFRRALDRDPGNIRARFLLGRELAILGDNQQAIRYLKELVGMDDPAVPSMLRVLAGTYGQAGDLESARRTLETALADAMRRNQESVVGQIEDDLRRLAAMEAGG
jgi:tetratricopeptide (TPR) repeat protein